MRVLNPIRRVRHGDLDCFFATVEELDDPSRQGKSVVVGGSPGRRGVTDLVADAALALLVREVVPVLAPDHAIRLLGVGLSSLPSDVDNSLARLSFDLASGIPFVQVPLFERSSPL